MKIKKNDHVIVIAGKDRGKNGTVTRAFPRLNRVLVEGVNIKKKHERSRKGNQKGQTIEKAFPIHASNVMRIDPRTKKRTRIRNQREGKRKVRIVK